MGTVQHDLHECNRLTHGMVLRNRGFLPLPALRRAFFGSWFRWTWQGCQSQSESQWPNSPTAQASSFPWRKCQEQSLNNHRHFWGCGFCASYHAFTFRWRNALRHTIWKVSLIFRTRMTQLSKCIPLVFDFRAASEGGNSLTQQVVQEQQKNFHPSLYRIPGISSSFLRHLLAFPHHALPVTSPPFQHPVK